MTKVKSARRLCGSGSRSAASNANKMRRRISVASSSVFNPGAQCSHYILRPGPFEQSYERLAATGWKLNLESAFRPGPSGTNTSKTKFSCRGCGCNAWGKADLQIACMRCSLPMMSADSGSYEQQQAAE